MSIRILTCSVHGEERSQRTRRRCCRCRRPPRTRAPPHSSCGVPSAGKPWRREEVFKSKVKEIKYALNGGACEAKTLQPLIGEASRLFSSLPSLKVGAAQVLNLGTTFGILKTRVESEVSISLGVTHKEPIPVELTFGEIHFEDCVNW